MRYYAYLFMPLIMSLAGLHAQDANVSDLNSEFVLEDSASEFGDVGKCQNFYNIKGHVEFLSKTKIQRGPFAREEIGYYEGEITFAHNWCQDDHNGIYGGVGVADYVLNWRDNPYFHRQSFPTVNFTLGGFTTFSKSWLWQGGISANVDANNPNLSDYTMYTVLAWGRYRYCDSLGLHVGLMYWGGIGQSWLLPILGLDYKFNKEWSLNLILPMNVSLVYAFAEHWALMLNGKLIYNRHRVSQNEALSRAIWQYRNVGAELALEYKYGRFLAANIHGGVMFAGQLQVSDRQNNHTRTYQLGLAGYVGAGFDFKF